MFFYNTFKNIFVFLNSHFNFINISTNSSTNSSTHPSTQSDLNYDLNYTSKYNKTNIFKNTNYNTFDEIEIQELSIYSNQYKEYTNYIYDNSDEMSRSIIWNY